MFNINVRDIALKLVPPLLRKTKLVEFLYSIIKPLQTINDSFSLFRNDIDYALSFNAQIIYLEHFLNDKYDPNLRRIYITDVANIKHNYIYNNVESFTPIYLYNNYRPTESYVAGDFVAVPIVGVGTHVYKARLDNSGMYPLTNSNYWQLVGDNIYILNEIEYISQLHYIVNVPDDVVYSEIIMRNNIDRYNSAGRVYQIINF